MKKLPKYEKPELGINDIFKPKLINLVSMSSFFKDGEMLFIDTKPRVIKSVPEIHTKSHTILLNTKWRSEYVIQLPIINLDGVLILLYDNLTSEHKEFLSNDTIVPKFNNSTKTANSYNVEFYSMEDPDLLEELTVEGMKQLKDYFVASEDFELAFIVDNRIKDDNLLSYEDHYTDKSHFSEETAIETAQQMGLTIVK
jgi:hypothetical protein